MTGRYDLKLGRPARRALVEELPEKIATACWELINGALRDDPRRVGKPLHEPFEGEYSARRSTYRVRYLIDDASWTVIVLDVQRRADAYRSH